VPAGVELTSVEAACLSQVLIAAIPKELAPIHINEISCICTECTLFRTALEEIQEATKCGQTPNSWMKSRQKS